MTYEVETGKGHSTLWVALHSWDFTDQVFPQFVFDNMLKTDPEEWAVPWCVPMFGLYYQDEAVLAKLIEFCELLRRWSFDGRVESPEEMYIGDLGKLFNSVFSDAVVELRGLDTDGEAINKLQDLIDFINEHWEERKKEFEDEKKKNEASPEDLESIKKLEDELNSLTKGDTTNE